MQTNASTHAPPYVLQNVTHGTCANQLGSEWLIPLRHPKSMWTIVQLLNNYLSQICTYTNLPKGVTYCAHFDNLCVHNREFWSCSNLCVHPSGANKPSEGFLPRQDFHEEKEVMSRKTQLYPSQIFSNNHHMLTQHSGLRFWEVKCCIFSNRLTQLQTNVARKQSTKESRTTTQKEKASIPFWQPERFLKL